MHKVRQEGNRPPQDALVADYNFSGEILEDTSPDNPGPEIPDQVYLYLMAPGGPSNLSEEEKIRIVIESPVLHMSDSLESLEAIITIGDSKTSFQITIENDSDVPILEIEGEKIVGRENIETYIDKKKKLEEEIHRKHGEGDKALTNWLDVLQDMQYEHTIVRWRENWDAQRMNEAA